MKEYIMLLFGVCLAAAVVKLAAPEGATAKYIEILCSLCVISALVLPLARDVAEVEDIGDVIFDEKHDTVQNYDEIYKSYLFSGEIAEVQKILSEQLSEHFQTETGALRVVLEHDGEKLRGASVIIGKGAVDISPSELKEYIKTHLDTDCTIIYDI